MDFENARGDNDAQNQTYLEKTHFANFTSEGVQSSPLLINLYSEFKNVVAKYSDDVATNLTPLMIQVLENINIAYQKSKEYEFKLNLLSEDKKELESRYELEKNHRENLDKEFSNYKQNYEQERTDLKARLKVLQSKIQLLELKHKDIKGYTHSLEEAQGDLQKEYDELHAKYTELFKAYIIFKERKELPKYEPQNVKKDLLSNQEKLKSEKQLVPVSNTQLIQENKNSTSCSQVDDNDSISLVSLKSVISASSLDKQENTLRTQEESFEEGREFKDVWFDLEDNKSYTVEKPSPSSSTLSLPTYKKRDLNSCKSSTPNPKSITNSDIINNNIEIKLNPKRIYTKVDMAQYLILRDHFHLGLQESVQWNDLLNSYQSSTETSERT